MTLRAVIVDDEPPARRRLRTLLTAEPSVAVLGDADDGASAIALIEHKRPDLVFLDVQMPGADGFDVVDALTESLGRSAPAVIFVTAFDEFALRAFEIHAVDYLLKPFDRRRLSIAVKRAHARLEGARALKGLLHHVMARRPMRRLLLREAGRVTFVSLEDIDWLGAAGHYVAVHVGLREHLMRGTLGGLAGRLPADQFVRIHRGTIVNVGQIAELRSLYHGDLDVVLRNGTRLQASRTYAGELRAAVR